MSIDQAAGAEPVIAPSRWRLPRALPPLGGAPLALFLAIWSILLALALAGAVMGAPNLKAPPPDSLAMVGLTTDFNSRVQGGRLTLGPPMGREATAAGIRAGDAVVAVDGRAAATDWPGLRAQLEGPVGSPVTVAIAAPSGRVATHRLTRDPVHREEGFATAGLTSGTVHFLRIGAVYPFDVLLPLACAILLLVRRLRDPLAPWASLVMLLLVLGNSQAGWWYLTLGSPWAALPDQANFVCFLLFALVLVLFPDGRFEPRATWAVAIAAVLGCIVTQKLDTAYANLAFFAVQCAAVWLITRRLRAMPPGPGRQQIRWALLGFAGACVALALLVVIQLRMGSVDDIFERTWLRIAEAWVVLLTNLPLILGLTVGLLRYRLYDAEATISRSAVYGALTVALLAIFAGSEKVIEMLGEQYFGESLGAMAGGLGAAFAAVMLVPMHHRVSHWAERRFQKQLIRLRQGLPLLVGDLRETAGLDRIAATVLDAVQDGVRASRAALVVEDRVAGARGLEAAAAAAWRAGWTAPAKDGIDIDRADAIFPVRVPLEADGHGRVGWLLLGPRPDGSFYGKDEYRAIAEVADPVARAIQIVLLRDAREADQERRMIWLEARISELLSRLAPYPPPGEVA